MKTSLLTRIFGVQRSRAPQRAAFSAAPESDAIFALGSRLGGQPGERYAPDRESTLRQALEAWRVNPLARRIVGLTSQYVVGGGININSPHEPTNAFLRSFWDHALNRLPVRVYEWCDELTRSGNLFLLLSTDAAGMSYLRAVPALQVRSIHTRSNDIDQETAYEMQPDFNDTAGARSWQAYDPQQDQPNTNGSFETVMLHYAINRAVGTQWGESDLAPVLRWLSRYSAWLEDRARLNHFRNAFLYVVRARYASEGERRARQSALNAAPPSPGSILVTDESESWDTLHPRLESDESGQDGLAMKKMLAAGAGIPLHFLAEPESATRTTAEAAGGPTYRHFEQRQRFFLWLLGDVLRAVVNRRSQVDQRVSRRASIRLTGADISARDNMALAMAASNIAPALSTLRERGLIDDAEQLRLFYRFCGEGVDVADMLARGRQAPPTVALRPAAAKNQPLKIDPLTGEEKGNLYG